MINPRSRRQLALSISMVAALSFAAVSCGSDAKEGAATTVAPSTVTTPTTDAPTTDAPTTESPTTEATPDTTAPTDETAATTESSTADSVAFDLTSYCDAELAIESAGVTGGDPSADPVAFATTLLPYAETVLSLAPAELVPTFTAATAALHQAVDTQDGSALAAIDTSAAHTFDAAHCSWTGESVTMENYNFMNLPSTLGSGDYDFEVSNSASEPHVLVIVKKKAGVTESWDELLASPEAEDKVETVMGAFAPPGGSGYGVVHLDAGEYMALCPISQGSTGDTEGTGPPHFTLGMHQLITVQG